MSTRGALLSAVQSTHTDVAQRLSPLLERVGWVAVPHVLIRYQARLGLTYGELNYVLHILCHKWTGQWPWVAVSGVVKATGHHERNIRSRKESLQKKGYLVCREQRLEDGGRGADEHDLSGLFAALERLAIEDRTQEAIDELQADLPEPQYDRSGLQLAASGEQRAMLAVRRRNKRQEHRREKGEPTSVSPGDIATTPPGNIATTRPAISPATPLALSPAQLKAGQQKPLTPPTPQGAQGADGRQDGAVVRKPDDTFQPALPGTAAVALPPAGHDDPAERLLVAFYRGLDSDIASLTSRQRQAKLKLARELVAAGATPGQAEAYARETNADRRRTAPVSLRSFAEERQAWLQRRGRSEASGPRLVDRTGQPPSWATDHAAERAAGEPRSATAGALGRAIVGGAS